MDMTINGKTFDPMAEINKALANVPPEQRKKMAEMMAGNNMMPVSKDGYHLCYTAEMVKKPEVVMEGTKNCTTKITSQTSKKIAGTFDCAKDGAKGDFVWTSKSNTEYDGLMNGKTAQGTTKIKYHGKFISANCGKVKPVL